MFCLVFITFQHTYQIQCSLVDYTVFVNIQYSSNKRRKYAAKKTTDFLLLLNFKSDTTPSSPHPQDS
jgi:hypothetical protein